MPSRAPEARRRDDHGRVEHVVLMADRETGDLLTLRLSPSTPTDLWHPLIRLNGRTIVTYV